MPEPKTPEELENERIAAWRAERASIAQADKEARIKSKEAETLRSKSKADDSRDAAALLMVQSTTRQSDRSDHVSREHGRKGISLGALGRFLVIVVAPFLVTAFYLFSIATPLYEAQSVVAISKSEHSTGNSSTGLLGGLQRPSNLSEMFRAHSYIRSQAMMDMLEAETDFITELSGPDIDFLRRLRDIETLSYSKLMQFDRFVETSVDVQSGLMTLYVRAPSKVQAIEISQLILRATEDQVNALGFEVFGQRQSHVVTLVDNAQQELAQAQAALVELQLKYQEVDPRNQIDGIYLTIRDLEAQTQELGTVIQRAEIAGVSSSSQTLQAIELQDSLDTMIQAERARLVTPIGESGRSLNSLLVEFELANLNVELAQDAVKAALTAQSSAAQDAALSRSIFQIVVPSRTAEKALYPKIPGILALTLVISLTVLASISLFWRPRQRY